MRCNSCGKDVPDGPRRCYHCGARLNIENEYAVILQEIKDGCHDAVAGMIAALTKKELDAIKPVIANLPASLGEKLTRENASYIKERLESVGAAIEIKEIIIETDTGADLIFEQPPTGSEQGPDISDLKSLKDYKGAAARLTPPHPKFGLYKAIFALFLFIVISASSFSISLNFIPDLVSQHENPMEIFIKEIKQKSPNLSVEKKDEWFAKLKDKEISGWCSVSQICLDESSSEYYITGTVNSAGDVVVFGVSKEDALNVINEGDRLEYTGKITDIGKTEQNKWDVVLDNARYSREATPFLRRVAEFAYNKLKI